MLDTIRATAYGYEAPNASRLLQGTFFREGKVGQRLEDLLLRQEITLNIPYDLSEPEWIRVRAVYESMDGWLGYDDGIPFWYGRERDARYICASVEPGGILFCGEVEMPFWIEWLTVLCARMSLALGHEVRDAEI